MVPHPAGSADPPAARCLQPLFSDPITYSSLDFSCLDLIILNPLYLIISSPARPDLKLPGGSPAASQKDNLSLIYAPGGGCYGDSGRLGESSALCTPWAAASRNGETFPTCCVNASLLPVRREMRAGRYPEVSVMGTTAHATPRWGGRMLLEAERSGDG